jgi:hypothetical protein
LSVAPEDEPPVLTPTETPPTVMVVPTGAGTVGVGTETVVEPPFEVTGGAAGTGATVGVVTGRLGSVGKETEVGRVGSETVVESPFEVTAVASGTEGTVERVTGRLGSVGKDSEVGSFGKETEVGSVDGKESEVGSVGKETEVGSGRVVLIAWVAPFATAVTVSTTPVNEPLEGRGSEPLPPEAPGRGRPVDVGSEPRLERVPVTSLTSPLTDGSTLEAPLPGGDPMLPRVHVTSPTRSASPLAQPLPEPPEPTPPACPIPDLSEPTPEIPAAVVPLEPAPKRGNVEKPLVSEPSTSASVATPPALDPCRPTPEWEAAPLMASAKGVP